MKKKIINTFFFGLEGYVKNYLKRYKKLENSK